MLVVLSPIIKFVFPCFLFLFTVVVLSNDLLWASPSVPGHTSGKMMGAWSGLLGLLNIQGYLEVCLGERICSVLGLFMSSPSLGWVLFLHWFWSRAKCSLPLADIESLGTLDHKWSVITGLVALGSWPCLGLVKLDKFFLP